MSGPDLPPWPAAQPRPPVLQTPLPELWLDGTPVPAGVLRTLGPVRVRQEMSAPTVCELAVDLTADLRRPRHGAAVRLRLSGSAEDLFDGEVVAVGDRLGPDGLHRVRLRCFDRAHRLRQTSAVTAHADVTVGELAAALAGPHGLGVDVRDDGPRWPRVLQCGESDLALLTRLASAAGLWWSVSGDRLTLRRAVAGETSSVRWGEDLYEAEIEDDATAATAQVRTLGWDPVARRGVEGSARRTAAAPRSGRADAAAEWSLVGGVWADREHADSRAQGELDRRGAEAVAVRAVLQGDVRWRPGVGLRLPEQPAELAGPYLLTAVEHVVDAASGYVCLVTSQPAPSGEPAGGGVPDAAAFTLAEVVGVDDPDQAGRVRVSLTAFDGLESEWLPVVGLGAGAGKGLLCQPDVGDSVLVLHAAADPGRGVVLGGLYAADLPAEAAGVTGGAVRRFGWQTADGQRLLLDRDADRAVLGNAAGSALTLAADGVRLHAATDLTIEAPGRRLVIRADSVDFERA